LGEAVKSNSADAERSLTPARDQYHGARSAPSAHDAERTINGMSTGVSNVLKQNAGEGRAYAGLPSAAEVARNFRRQGRGNLDGREASAPAEMTYIVDEKSSGLLAALTNKSEEFVSEVSPRQPSMRSRRSKPRASTSPRP